MASFFLELKSLCKSYKFLLLIMILLLLQLVFIQQAISENKRDERIRLDERKEIIRLNRLIIDSFERDWERGLLNITPEQYEAALKYYQYRVKLAEELYDFYIRQDWLAYNRQTAITALLVWEHSLQNYSPQPQEYFGEDWDQIKSKFQVPVFDVHPGAVHHFSYRNDQAPPFMLDFISSLDLAETSLPPTGAHDTSPWAYLLNFLRSGFPRILGAIVLLMTVNILHRDKNFGTVKTTLSAPPSRGRYLFRKLTLGFAAGISVTVLPQVPAFLILGIKHGFRGLGYPVLVDRYVLSNFTVFPANTHFTGFLDANLSKIPNSIDIARLEFFDFIPLWQFLGLAAVQILFFILFCTALAMLISVLVKNEVIAHLVAAGIFAVGSALGKIVPALSTTAWDLFSKADVVPLLEGSLASSYPSSLLTLALASILLVTAGAVIFRRQDIISN